MTTLWSPGQTGNIVLGSIITFTPGTTISVSRIIGNDDIKPTTITTVFDRKIALSWGIKYVGPKVDVVFYRAALDGKNSATYSNNGGYLTPLTYAQLLVGQSSNRTLNFVDRDGRNAYIDIDPSTGGISRRFP